jgi:aspartate-semialdehyde dehydrogenase
MAHDILHTSPGIKIVEDRSKNMFPMPIDAAGNNDVLCGRIREDLSQSNTLDIWVVADQL